jgi:hypothetical protein
VASSGCDAQPYFRIFNPISQSEKFDAQGAFIRRYLPVLAQLDAKSIHAPWLARPLTLAAAGVVLGDGPDANYPLPVVDHSAFALDGTPPVSTVRLRQWSGRLSLDPAAVRPGPVPAERGGLTFGVAEVSAGEPTVNAAAQSGAVRRRSIGEIRGHPRIRALRPAENRSCA